MRFIWATRGRSWGFRFLRNAGFADPLPEYEKAFFGADAEPQIFRRVGDAVALRFPDPEGRRDRVRRIIPHEFVLYGQLAAETTSVSDALQQVWPLVADEYASLWKAPKPPATRA